MCGNVSHRFFHVNFEIYISFDVVLQFLKGSNEVNHQESWTQWKTKSDNYFANEILPASDIALKKAEFVLYKITNSGKTKAAF